MTDRIRPGERVSARAMKRLMPPHRICRWLGHTREQYIGRQYLDRRGNLRPVYYARCTRCGISDAAEVYAAGLLERLRWFNLRMWWLNKCGDVRGWFCTTCFDCGKPERRLGRRVGDHRGCIPF